MAIQDNNQQYASEFARLMNGANNNNAQNQNNKSGNNSDRPKAKYWLNVGMMTKVTNESGEEVDHFVALPQGIPLDTMEPLAIRGQNMDYRARLTAQNDLLQQVITVASSLAPGETRVLSLSGGLQVQVRHVAEELKEIPADQNAYRVNLLAVA